MKKTRIAIVDAIAVLTPPNTHLGIVKRCAEAGKHVLLEKPLEITTARAEEMVARCRAGGVTLGVVLQHRHKPAVERLAELQRGEEIGALVGASAIIRLWRPQSYYDEPGRGARARDGGGVLIRWPSRMTIIAASGGISWMRSSAPANRASTAKRHCVCTG